MQKTLEALRMDKNNLERNRVEINAMVRFKLILNLYAFSVLSSQFPFMYILKTMKTGSLLYFNMPK